MRTMCRSSRRAVWSRVAIFALIAAAATCGANADEGGTQTGGVSAARNEQVSPAHCDGSVLVTSVRWDPVLHRRWEMVVPCGHPDWPASELPAHGMSASMKAQARTAAQSVTPPLVVRAGDVVQLWSQQGSLRIEAAGIAEQGGSVGQIVRVRLAPRRTLGQQVEEQFRGVIRGPRNVEMSQ